MDNNHAIVNAKIVNEGQIIEGDLTIINGKIAGINQSIPAGTPTTDADGAWLIPGMIDDQVHFREPGFEHKGTIATESRAAIAGGITSYMEMPNCNPLTTTHQELENKHSRASESSAANYAFYFGATNENLEIIKTVDPKKTCGIKVFMGASTGDMLVDNPKALEGIFGGTELLVATHCEDTPTILANEERARKKFGGDIPLSEHPNIRSVEACYLSSSLAVGLAKRHGTRLHVLHLTTEKEMGLFEPGPIEKKKITAEACIHHLFFNDSWYLSKGTDIKCNPAIKASTDQQALQQAIRDDRIDVIATDHAPHTIEEKSRPYSAAPAGLPLVQDALPALLDLVDRGIMDIETMVKKTSHSPAKLFGVINRGFIREGYQADLALVKTNTTREKHNIYAKCGWSPFKGITMKGSVQSTWVNGYLRYNNGQILDGPMGEPLEFER